MLALPLEPEPPPVEAPVPAEVPAVPDAPERAGPLAPLEPVTDPSAVGESPLLDPLPLGPESCPEDVPQANANAPAPNPASAHGDAR